MHSDPRGRLERECVCVGKLVGGERWTTYGVGGRRWMLESERADEREREKAVVGECNRETVRASESESVCERGREQGRESARAHACERG